MPRLLRLGSAIALICGMVLPGFSGNAAASNPGLPSHSTSTYKCGTGFGTAYHEMTATVSKTLAAGAGGIETIWNRVSIEATPNSGFHIYVLDNGGVIKRLRGIRNSSRSRSAAVNGFPVVVQGAGSKLFITAFFANHTSCSVPAS
jgi:hypothetical protein